MSIMLVQSVDGLVHKSRDMRLFVIKILVVFHKYILRKYYYKP